MNDQKLPVSSTYSEHHIDFALVGKGLNDTFCLQLISNKPFPVVKSFNNQDPHNTNIELEMTSFLTHECTVYMGAEQLTAMKMAIENALDVKENS